jgi:membrane protease YdiL (CAAX protease family)
MIPKIREFFAKMPDWLEIFIVITICFGISVYGSIRSFNSGAAFTKIEFNDARILSSLIFEFIATIICLCFLWLRNYKIGERLKFEPSIKGTLLGIGLFFATYLVYIILIIVVFTIVGEQNIPVAQYVVTVSLPLVAAISIINPLFEETFVMGYIFDKLEPHGALWAITASVLIRTSYHLYQGWTGIISLLTIGLIFALVYWRYRNLWAFYFAHVLMDFTGLL